VGCAGIKDPGSQTGTGGIGGIGGPPPINGLESLTVNPPTASVTLMPTGAGSALRATQQFTATGVINGMPQDVSTQVSWSSNLMGVTFTGGTANVSSPGVYTITAKSGSVSASAMLTATYSGDQFDPGFNQGNANKTALDGSPSGTTQIMYPVDKSLFPSNLTPIYAQVMASGAGSVARLNFQATGLSVNYYANCAAADDTNGNDPLPGGGCYVKLPLALTQLFIATSEKEDIRMTARVLSGTGAMVESQTISVAWANVGLSGGLYYWSVVSGVTICPGNPPAATPGTYCRLDPRQTWETDPLLGTAIYRYDLTNGTPAPTVTWTDDGGPRGTTPYNGAPQAFVAGTAGGHCIGCHAISNDGKYMALTLGGSSSTDGANFALLDIAMQQLISINPSARTDPNSSPTANPADYWKQFRHEGLAAENAWGPNTDRLVSMFQSRLYLTAITVSGTTGTAQRMGQVIPSWGEYATDPFWSHDGSLFVFTSFATPTTHTYNPTGLNGDMRRGGKIGIATATATGINDDAQDLVPRAANVSSYYPSISNDSKLVVFNQSTCSADPNATDVNKLMTDYGNYTCDGYDDSSATLFLVNASPGARPIQLNAANGAAGNANSWPRFSPDKGTFRGETLYWIAFSSRRPYGMQVNYQKAATLTKPQLWIAGVRAGEVIVGDPSYGAVWLPTQNPKQATPPGNHVPQWVKFAVVIEG
jgi:hypothetical protein